MSYPWKHCQIQDHNAFVLFSSKSFIVSGLTFRSLIRLKLVFVYGVRWGSNFLLLHVESTSLPLLMKPHPKYMQFSIQPRLRETPVHISRVLFAQLPLLYTLPYKSHSPLSLQSLSLSPQFSNPVTLCLNSPSLDCNPESISRKSWGDEGIVELTFSCPGSECPEDTPVLVTPASLEANFSPYLFCLIVSCSECFQILFYLNIENILCLTIPISKVLHV